MMRKDMPLQVNVIDDVLTIQIGVDTLADSAKRHPDWYDEAGEPRLNVTNASQFADEVTGALNREEEDGTTPLHTLLDEAMTYVVEQGGEGVDLATEFVEYEDEQ